MFASLTSSSISLATVTPSLVTVGAPHDFSMTTLRPRGPRVTLTALARVSTPAITRLRARSSKMMSLAAMICLLCLLDHTEDLVLAQDDVLHAVHLDLGAGVLAEEDPVARLHVELDDGAVLELLARADGDDVPLERALLRGVGDDDATAGLLDLLDAANHDAVPKRTDVHDGDLSLFSSYQGETLLALTAGDC